MAVTTCQVVLNMCDAYYVLILKNMVNKDMVLFSLLRISQFTEERWPQEQMITIK